LGQKSQTRISRGLENQPRKRKKLLRKKPLEKRLSIRERKKSNELAPPKLERQQSVGKTLEDQLRKVWKQAAHVIYKDLPRLAKRITIHAFPSGVEVALEGQTESKDSKDKDTPVEGKEKEKSRIQWKTIANVIETVANRLEDDATQAKISKGLDDIVSELGSSFDIELTLEEAFKKFIGLDSKTGRIFRATNQSILFPAILHLRQQVYGEEVGMTKDVRRPDGWVIKIQLGDANFVTHTRWEQSIAEPGSPEFFEVQWEIRLSFDKAMSDVKAVFLRIMDLKFSDSMSKERKETLKNILRGDGYIV